MKIHSIKYSVIICARNEAEKIGATIGSINCYAIDRNNIEIIVIDDGSIDNTSLRIQSLKNTKLMVNKESKGISACRNQGIEKASGDFIVFLDAHVRLKSDIFSIYDSYFATYADLDGISGTYYSILNTDNNIVRDVVRSVYRRKDEDEFFITADNFTTISSCIFCIRTTAIIHNLFPISFKGVASEDTFVQLRLLEHGYNIMHSNKVRIIHDANLSYCDLLKKIFYQCHGAQRLLAAIVQNKIKKTPFSPFYLDFPLLTCATFYIACISIIWGKSYFSLLLLAIALLIDFCALSELIGLTKFSRTVRIKTVVYILLNEIIKIFGWPISIIRERYSINNLINVISILLKWEARKIHYYFWRKLCNQLTSLIQRTSRCFYFQKD